jgi:hypothetical protein
MRRGGKKLSNIFKRFYTNFEYFGTFFANFRKFSNVFERFLHELARLVLPHLAYLPHLKALSIKNISQNLPLPADKLLPKRPKSR